jgi:hypothetical protein
MTPRPIFLVAFLAVTAFPASAALVQYGLMDREDGLVTRDTTSSLEWLDLTATQNKSYQDVIGGYGSYTTTHGFRVATHSEVRQLFQNLGLTNQWADIPGYITGVTELLRFLGALTEIDYGSPRTQYQSHGMWIPNQPCCSSSPGVSTFTLTYDYTDPVSGRAYLDNGYTNFQSALDYRGTFLVRTARSPFDPAANPSTLLPPSIAYNQVPEPNAAVLLATALLCLLATGKQSSRSSAGGA